MRIEQRFLPDGSKLHELTVGGELKEIPRAAAWLASLADGALFAPGLLYNVQLCLEEALANIMMHGLGGVAEPRIHMRLSGSGGDLKLEIEDNGLPFDPATFVTPPPPRSLDEAQPGGLGIPLMRKFAGAMHYARDARGNRLTLTFDSAVRRDGSSARGR